MSNLVIAKQSSFPSPEEFQVMKDITLYAFNSGLLPSSVSTKEKALIIVMKSRALGIDPMHGLWSISVINNKPCMSAELMLTMIYKNVQGATVDYVKTDNNECIIEAQRPGGKKTRFTFTIEDARRANLLKGPWLTYPAAMLRARCVAAMARALFADALAGVIYTPEELGAEVNEDGEVRDVTPPDDTPPSGGKKPVETAPTEPTQPTQKPTNPVTQKPVNGSNGEHVIQDGKYSGLKIRELIDGKEGTEFKGIGMAETQRYIQWLEKNGVNSGWATQFMVNAKRFMTEIQKNHAEASEQLFPNLTDSFDDVDTAYDAAKKVT